MNAAIILLIASFRPPDRMDKGIVFMNHHDDNSSYSVRFVKGNLEVFEGRRSSGADIRIWFYTAAFSHENERVTRWKKC